MGRGRPSLTGLFRLKASFPSSFPGVHFLPSALSTGFRVPPSQRLPPASNGLPGGVPADDIDGKETPLLQGFVNDKSLLDDKQTVIENFSRREEAQTCGYRDILSLYQMCFPGATHTSGTLTCSVC